MSGAQAGGFVGGIIGLIVTQGNPMGWQIGFAAGPSIGASRKPDGAGELVDVEMNSSNLDPTATKE